MPISLVAGYKLRSKPLPTAPADKCKKKDQAETLALRHRGAPARVAGYWGCWFSHPPYDVVEIRIEVDRVIRAATAVDVARRTIGREDFVVAGYTSDSLWLDGSAVGIVGFDGVGPRTSKETVGTDSSQHTVTAIIAEKMVRAAITSQAVEAAEPVHLVVPRASIYEVALFGAGDRIVSGSTGTFS